MYQTCHDDHNVLLTFNPCLYFSQKPSPNTQHQLSLNLILAKKLMHQVRDNTLETRSSLFGPTSVGDDLGLKQYLWVVGRFAAWIDSSSMWKKNPWVTKIPLN